jgi:hypothetical protein
VLLLVPSGCASAPDRQAGDQSTGRTAVALRVAATRTRRFVVGLYDASGAYPQVKGDGVELTAVNASLRRAVVSDQRGYVAAMGDTRPGHVGALCGGIYETWVDSRLVSASTSVVSALLAAFELNPCGNDAQGWVSMTVRVPSGVPVRFSELFANPARGFRVLANAWKRQFRRSDRVQGKVVTAYPEVFAPRAFRNAYFALAPHGLAVGFRQVGPTSRLHAIVPYRTLRPYLSNLGLRLIASVRPARYGRLPRYGIAASSLPALNGPPAEPVRHRFFRTSRRTRVDCELADGVRNLPNFVECLIAPSPTRALRVDMSPSARLRICHGIRCMSNVPLHETRLGQGEWVESNRFFCVAVNSGVRCLNLDGRGFLLGPKGLTRVS